MASTQSPVDQTAATATSPPRQPGAGTVELTPEVVRQVADRVFALLMQELRTEHERRRPLRSTRW